MADSTGPLGEHSGIERGGEDTNDLHPTLPRREQWAERSRKANEHPVRSSWGSSVRCLCVCEMTIFSPVWSDAGRNAEQYTPRQQTVSPQRFKTEHHSQHVAFTANKRCCISGMTNGGVWWPQNQLGGCRGGPGFTFRTGTHCDSNPFHRLRRCIADNKS